MKDDHGLQCNQKEDDIEAARLFELAKQTNQSAIDYGLRALQSIFLINGAAATAILASNNAILYSIAIKFAFGAGVAVFLFGLSYLYSLLCAEYTMLQYRYPGNDSLLVVIWKKVYTIDGAWLHRLRNLIFIIFIANLILFMFTLISAWQILNHGAQIK